MQRVKAHALRKLEEPKLVEELTKHRVSVSHSKFLGHWSRLMPSLPSAVSICAVLIWNLMFRKSSPALESARFLPNPRWSLPRLDKWERQSQRSWPSSLRRESPLLDPTPRERDTSPRTSDRRRPEPSEEDCLHSRRSRRPLVSTRGNKLSNLESTLLLNEM